MKKQNFITIVPPTDENPHGGQLFIGVKGYVQFEAFTGAEQAEDIIESDSHMSAQASEDVNTHAAQCVDEARKEADRSADASTRSNDNASISKQNAEDAKIYANNAKGIRDEIVKRIEDLMELLKMQGVVNPLNTNEVPTGSQAIDGKGHPPVDFEDRAPQG